MRFARRGGLFVRADLPRARTLVVLDAVSIAGFEFLSPFFHSFPSYRISHGSFRRYKQCCSFNLLVPSPHPPQIKYTSIGPRIVPSLGVYTSSSKQYPVDLSNRDKARRRSFNRRSKLPKFPLNYGTRRCHLP